MAASRGPMCRRADAQGCDAAVTDIRMRPKGTMPGQGVGSPNFDLQFRVIVN